MKIFSNVIFLLGFVACTNAEAGRRQCPADAERWECGFYYNYLMHLVMDTAASSGNSGLWLVSGLKKEKAEDPILINTDALQLEQVREIGNRYLSENFEAHDNRQTVLHFSSTIMSVETCEPSEVFIMLHRQNQPAFVYLPRTGRIHRYGTKWVGEFGC